MIKANFFKFSVHFLKINFLKSRLRRSNFLASFSIFSRLNLTFEDHGTIFYLSQLHFLNFFNIRPLKFITRTLFIKYQGNHSQPPLKNKDFRFRRSLFHFLSTSTPKSRQPLFLIKIGYTFKSKLKKKSDTLSKIDHTFKA